jgi:UDP-2,4-diacetamido-2,4,6-trideoxy-beta-L-altropyranose hydrolase
MTAVVGIRANAGPTVGFGHVRRCVSLAEALIEKGAEVVFFANAESQPDSWLPRARTGIAHVEIVPADEARTLTTTYSHARNLNVQVLVVDSYDSTAEALAKAPITIATIIDEAPALAIPAMLIVNGAADAASASHPLATGARALLGPEYVLLRREFAVQEPRVLRPETSHVLVMAGGGDSTGLSLLFVDCVRVVLRDATITVVVGPFFSDTVVAALRDKAASDPRLHLVRDPSSVRELMMSADVAITSGGQTTYELAATGLPACAVRVALNQTGNLEGLRARDAILWVGDVGDADLPTRVDRGLRALVTDARLRQSLSRAGQMTVDGRGASRVADAILELCA